LFLVKNEVFLVRNESFLVRNEVFMVKNGLGIVMAATNGNPPVSGVHLPASDGEPTAAAYETAGGCGRPSKVTGEPPEAEAAPLSRRRLLRTAARETYVPAPPAPVKESMKLMRASTPALGIAL
jgi:hypothetical protein